MNENEKAVVDHLVMMTEVMAGLKARLDNHDTRAASLAQRCETRITALEQRLAALEEPAYPDDVRDALAELDKLSDYWAGRALEGRLPGLWKLDNFPPIEDGE